MLPDQKKPWQSKTMLLNGIGGLVLFVGLFVPGAEVVDSFIKLNATTIGMVWSVLNMVLRAMTKDKIVLVD